MRALIKILLPIGALLAALCWANTALAQTRTWGVAGLYGDIIAVDCINCGDDIGLSLACQGEGSAAAVRVPFAAIDISAGATSPITFDLDGERFTFAAESELQSLVGFVPLFYLPPNHPMVAALQSASAARISFAGLQTRVGLRGSRDALDIFKAHCGWTNLPAVTEKEPTFDGPQWFTSEFVDDVAGTSGVNLAYGVPQTDNVLVTDVCAGGTGARTVEMNLFVDFGGAADGDDIDAVIEVDGQEFSYSGTVFEDGSEFAGVRIEIGRRAPLWHALAGSRNVRVGVDGGGLMRATSEGAATAIPKFTDACFNAPVANAPLVQLGSLAPADPAPAAAAPLIKLDLGGIAPVEQPAPAPLVKLNLGTATPVPSTTQPLVQLDLGVAAQPALPSYRCDDGSLIQLAIEGETAQLGLPGGERLALAEIPAPFGRKFSDGQTIVHGTDSATIQLTRPSGRQLCQRQ